MHYRYYRPYYCRRCYGRYYRPYYYRRYYYPLYNEYYQYEYQNDEVIDKNEKDEDNGIKPYPHPTNVEVIEPRVEVSTLPSIVPHDPNRQLPQ